MSRETRYRGYQDNCRICSRKFRGETLLGIAAMVKDHEEKCEREHRAREERDATERAMAAAQPDLFGGK